MKAYVIESGVPSRPRKQKRRIKKRIRPKSSAASRTIRRISCHSGSSLTRKAVPAAPIRLDTSTEGSTPVATVRI